MNTGKIPPIDTVDIAKILNRNNYILILVGIVFMAIDFDMFSAEPRLIKVDKLLYQIVIVIAQLIFVASLYKWEYDKQKIINILTDGVLVKGNLKYTEKLQSNRQTNFFLHLFEYKVEGQSYEAAMQNKKNHTKSSYIVYQKSNPKKSIVFDDLRSELRTLIKQKMK